MGRAVAGARVAARRRRAGGRRRPRRVRHADRVLDLRHVDQLQAAGRPRRRSPNGSSSCCRRPARRAPASSSVDAPTRSGPSTLSFSVSLADGHIVPNTTFVARWRVTDADGKTWVGPPVSQTYADDAGRLEDAEGQARHGSLVRGRRRVRPAGAEDRRRRGRPDVAAPRRDRDRPDRLLHLRRPGQVLRRAGAGDPRERRRRGPRRHPDDVRPDHAGRDQRQLGVDRRPARADPPRLRHGDEEPVPRAAALAERGPGGLSLGGLRLELPQPGRERGEGRLDHAARRPGRRVPDDPRPVLPGVRRERLRGRLDRREQGP